jgi:hypothetical protein
MVAPPSEMLLDGFDVCSTVTVLTGVRAQNHREGPQSDHIRPHRRIAE